MVKSARRVLTTGVVLFLLFFALTWQTKQPSLIFLLEFVALSAGCAALWLFGDERPVHGSWAIVIAHGATCLFAMLEFGPNMGVGVLSFTWLLAISGLLGYSWTGAVVICIVFTLTAFGTLSGWIGQHWYFSMQPLDWFRSGSVVFVLLLGTAYVLNRINAAIAEAWTNEAAALAERSEAERALMESQRMESIGKLAGGVAHDFNNALAVLVAGIDALKRAESDEQRAPLIDNMEQAIRGGVATTRQLLSLSRQGHEPGQPANPKLAIEELLPNLKRLFPETIEIHTDLQLTPQVSLSSGELEQVVLNLCLNARDAMPEGGQLTVFCASREATVLIEVRDSGVGMEDSTLKQATGHFFTTKQSGTGLGLAMVQDMVKATDGQVEIESSTGAGTTVRLILPALSALQTAETAGASVKPGTKGAPAADRSLLLLEDNQMVREMYSEVLSHAGFQVQAVETVAEARKAIEDNNFAIFVSDAMLPDGEPSSAIKQFRKGGWKPVLVVSGHIDSDELIADLGQGDYSFIQKPFPNQVLVSTVEELLLMESSTLA